MVFQQRGVEHEFKNGKIQRAVCGMEKSKKKSGKTLLKMPGNSTRKKKHRSSQQEHLHQVLNLVLYHCWILLQNPVEAFYKPIVTRSKKWVRGSWRPSMFYETGIGYTLGIHNDAHLWIFPKFSKRRNSSIPITFRQRCVELLDSVMLYWFFFG